MTAIRDIYDPDDPTAEMARLRDRIAALARVAMMTDELLEALEASGEPDVLRVCAAIGALRGRPADDPHDWIEWSRPYTAGSGRMIQVRWCRHCGETDYRDAVDEQPSLADCDPGDEQVQP